MENIRLTLGGDFVLGWTSHKMQHIPPSGTLKMLDIATKMETDGKRVYHFELGQPDFPTPANIVAAGVEALKDGFTRYVSSRGIPPLLDAIQEFYAKRGIDFDGHKNVIVSPGAKMALFSAFLSSIDAGDDILILSPDWPTYRVMSRITEALPIPVPTSSSYEIDEEALKGATTKSVSAIMINSPNNPTGGVLTKDQLKFIFDLATDNQILIFSDEIYDALIYNGKKQTSMLEIDTAMERTLVFNGFSKAYSMTGWRLGYAIGDKAEIKNLVRIQQNTTSCAPSFVQVAGVEALRGDQSSIERMREAYKQRRDVIVKLFSNIEGVTCAEPTGAFYCFPDFSEFGLTSNTLAELMLKKTGVVSTPGIVFGEEWDHNLRFSYATSLHIIREGLSLVADFLETLR